MERNREARRVTMAGVNGGLSRRRQRSSCLRDSPDEDGGMEMHETTRLRDRGSKKDRDRDRSSRSKRRRGDRLLHGSNRDEEEDGASDESVDEEEDDGEDDAAVAVRLPPPPLNPAPSSSSSLPQNHHHRKNFPPKVMRVPPWKAADEIGVPIPRKARSGWRTTAKRSHECWVSGGGGSGEQIQRQPSMSPSRLSPASTAQISPTSSNASVRRKMKQISGTKQRSPKMSKSSSTQEAIEIEVAEVLFKMTRQIPPKQEAIRIDSKDAIGLSNEAKSRISSPNSISHPPISLTSVLPSSNLSSNAPLSAVAPKRKRPRPVKFEDETPMSPVSLLSLRSTSVSSAAKMDMEQPMQSEATSPKAVKAAPSLAGENDAGSTGFGASMAVSVPPDAKKELDNLENCSEVKVFSAESNGRARIEIKEDVASPKGETPRTDLDVDIGVTTTISDLAASTMVSDSHREEKFCFDLMAPPPGKSSPERDSLVDFVNDHKSAVQEVSKLGEGAKGENAERLETREILLEDKKGQKSMADDFDLKKPVAKENTLDLQLDLEKPDKGGTSGSKDQLLKHQSRASRMEPKPDVTCASLPMPMIAGWPGSFPPLGYMGQVPSLQAVAPIDGAVGSSIGSKQPNLISPPARPKRCATHCYIAQNIFFHQRIARTNPFWPAAAGTAPMFGTKPMNLNVAPPSGTSFPGNPLQGSFPARTMGCLQDNNRVPIVPALMGHPPKEKVSTGNNNFVEAAQMKQLVLQQMPPQPGSASSMLGPAFIFPLNQQQAVAAVRNGTTKSTPAVGNAAPSSSASSLAVVSSGAGGAPATLNFGYAPLVTNDAQYLAILQNSGYPFPIPTHIGGPPYRGAPTQALPFFNGSFYSPQMLHPMQLQQQQQQQVLTAVAPQQSSHAQQGHQNTSTSSGSSSSQKHPQQQQRVSAGGSSHSFPATKQRPQLQAHQARQLESEAGCEDSPSSAGSRVSQAQKSIYGHSLATSTHPPNLMPTAAAASLGSGGGQTEKQQQSHKQPTMKVELTPSQAFAMSFASSFNAGAAPSGLDFSSMAQNIALFQSLPEAAKHGYQITAAASSQHKKPHPQMVDDAKSAGNSSMNANMTLQEERTMMMATGKAPGTNGSQHSLAVPDSSRVLHLVPASANCSRSMNRSTNAAAPTTTAPSTSSQQFQLQQQQLQLHLQMQHQQQLQLQHQLASSNTKSSASNKNANVCSERLPSGSTMTKFPQTLAGFHQGLVQGSSPSHSPQWKASGKTGTPVNTYSPDPAAMKTHHLLQQQGRASQQTPPTPSHHQTQISFGTNPLKAATDGAQHLSGGGTSNLSASSAATATPTAMSVGSPSNSVSKSTGGSPRASTSGKPGLPPATTMPLVQQSSTKSTRASSSSSRKSSPNRNSPSILGHPHIIPATNSSTAQQLAQLQQQQQYHRLQKQPQLFYSNAAAAYMQAQPPHSSSSQQRRQSEQQPQQQNSYPVSTGILAPCSSAQPMSGSPTTSDPAKAAASGGANSMKGLPPAGLLQAAQLAAAAAQSASGNPHPLMFPYMSSLSVKPAADQKATAGNDNLHPCWQPEKR